MFIMCRCQDKKMWRCQGFSCKRQTRYAAQKMWTIYIYIFNKQTWRYADRLSNADARRESQRNMFTHISYRHTQTHTDTNLHTETFTHRSFTHKNVYTQKFYTQKLLHTEACTPEHTNDFTHRSFYTQTFLHTIFFYTHRFLRTETFTHRHFYTQTLLRTDAFEHSNFYTQKHSHTETFTHRTLCRQKLLYTDVFTHRNFYIEKFLHTHCGICRFDRSVEK